MILCAKWGFTYVIYFSGNPFCPVKSFLKYISKLNPNKTDLWQHPKDSYSPDDDVWYVTKDSYSPDDDVWYVNHIHQMMMCGM